MKKLLFLLLLLPLTVSAQFTIQQGGTGINTITSGDIIYAASTNPIRFNKLNIGANGTCLTSNGSVPSWTTCSSGGSAYPFPLTTPTPGNATSTLTQFNGGLTAYASSTIGAGTQTTGLTVLGGATTTALLINVGVGYIDANYNSGSGLIIRSTTNNNAAYAHFVDSNGQYFDFGKNSSGTSDAYFYTPNDVPLNFYNNNALRVTIGSGVNGGNLGIGTALPSSKLTILDTGGTSIKMGNIGAADYGGVSFNGSITTYNIASAGSDPALYINRPTGSDIYFKENNAVANQMIIKTGGAVGIGTSLPVEVNANSHVTVAGTGSQDIIASSTDNTTLSDAILQAYAPGSRLFLGAHGTNQVTTQYGITVGGWGEVGAINSSFGSSNGLLIGTRTTNTPIVFGTNSLERMRIDQNGSVGIGTTTPKWSLNIASTTGPQIALTGGNANNIWTIRGIGGAFYLATASPTTFASSSAFTPFSISSAGTTTLQSLNIISANANGTSTSNVGWNITTGCYAISGTCISGSSSGSSSVGPINVLQASNGSGGFIATGTPTLTIGNLFSTTTATSTFAGSLTVGSASPNPLLQIGSTTPTYGYLINDRFNIVDSRNDYVAGNAYNLSNGICATADWTVANDLNSTALNFGDFGHTSSKFTGSGCTNNPFTGFQNNSTYIFDPTGYMNFALGTTTLGSFNWFTGGYATTNQKMTLTNFGLLGIGTTTPFTELQIATTSANGGFKPQFALTDMSASVGGKQWYQSNYSGVYELGTTSDNNFATSSAVRISTAAVSQWGFGTSTPYADFSINPVAGGSPYQFAIGSSTATNLVVTNGGRVGIGTTSPQAQLAISTTTAGNMFLLGSSTGYALLVNGAGNIYAPLTTSSGASQTGYWCYDTAGQLIRDTTVCLVSARKFKENIKPLDVGLKDLLGLEPVSYYYKDKSFGANQQMGLIADDVANNPRLDTMLVTRDNQGDIHGFNYETFTALITKSIQEFYAQFQKLVGRVSGLEVKMEKQQQEIDSLQKQINNIKK